MKLLKLMGIIAMAAVIGFGVLSCDMAASDEETGQKGTIHISLTAGGATKATGEQTAPITLHAVYTATGSETASGWQWKKDDVDISGATSNSYTATEAGTYKVSAMVSGSRMSSDNSVVVKAGATQPESAAFYIITGSGTTFTAKKGTTLALATTELATAKDKPIQDVINAIRADADGENVGIQFGNGTETLNIGNNGALFSNTGGTWGYVAVTGKITSANSTTEQFYTTVQFGDGVSGSLNADVATTANTWYAVQKAGAGILTILGGEIKGGTSSGEGIDIRQGTAETTGSVIVNGGTITGSTGISVGNSGSLTVTGGTITGSGAGISTVNPSNTVTISGGTVSATSNTGNAIRDLGPSTFVLSGNAVITSANSQTSGDNQGTIRLWYSTSSAQVTTRTVLEIGPNVTITNTGGGVEIYNPREHKVVDNRAAAVAKTVVVNTITGTATQGMVILVSDITKISEVASYTAMSVANITSGTLTAPLKTTAATPADWMGTGPYFVVLVLGSNLTTEAGLTAATWYVFTDGKTVEQVGTDVDQILYSFVNTSPTSTFAFNKFVDITAMMGGGDEGDHYIISVGEGAPFTVTRGASFATATNEVTGGTGAIQDVIDAIRSYADGDDVYIQFGNGTTALNIGATSAIFENESTQTWGTVNLSGKITGSPGTGTATAIKSVITIDIGVVAFSSADIAVTGTASTYTSGISKKSKNDLSDALTITGGTINNTASSGAGIIVGTDAASSGKVVITDGTISGNIGVDNYNSLTITGGTVSGSTAAIWLNNVNSTVTVNGTVATATQVKGIGTGRAIHVSAGASAGTNLITLEGSPTITSETTSYGTITLPDSGTSLILTIGKDVTLNNTSGTGTTKPTYGPTVILNQTLANTKDNRDLGDITYIVTSASSNYVATKFGVTVSSSTTLATVIEAIRTNADGKAITIQFVGTGNNALDITTSNVAFANSGANKWGAVEITGKLTSSSANGTINLASGLDSNFYFEADITNTSATANSSYAIRIETGYTSGKGIMIQSGTYSANSHTIYHNGSADLWLDGSCVIQNNAAATTGFTAGIYNASNGDIDIDAAAQIKVTAGNAIVNAGAGEIAIGGTGTVVSATGSGNAISFGTGSTGTGKVTISGGEVSAEAETIVVGKAPIEIKGGTIKSTGDSAIYFSGADASGIVTMTGGTVTAAGNYSTIYLSETATATTARFDMSAGTVSYTGPATGQGAVYIKTTNGKVNITGGTVTAAATAGYVICIDDPTGATAVTIGTGAAGTITEAGVTISGSSNTTFTTRIVDQRS